MAYWHIRSTRVRVHPLLRSRMLPVFSPGLGVRVTRRSLRVFRIYVAGSPGDARNLSLEWGKMMKVLMKSHGPFDGTVNHSQNGC